MILEPVQGEGGFIEMPADFPAKLRELCDRHGILWIDDEVQSGVGRTGPVWAIEHYDAQPDLLVSGKSLGGGLPLAAVTGPAAIMDAVDPGGLGGTFGGNPVSCAAANVVLDAGAGHAGRVRGAGHAAARRAGGHGDARGDDRRGARARPDARAGDRARPRDEDARRPSWSPARSPRRAQEGLLLLACGLHGNVIRLLPPLTISDDELTRGLEILEASLS